MIGALDRPEHFEFVEDRAVYRPAAKVTLTEGVRLVTYAITYARQEKVLKFLVNVSGLTGFPPPSIAERYFYVHEWAAATSADMCVALVSRRELMDPDKFCVTVAVNAGVCGEAFETEAEAIAWLQNAKPA